MTEDEMVGWHHQLNGHEFEQALGVGDGGKPGVLQSLGLQRVGHNCMTELKTLGLQGIPVATREESGVHSFPSRRGLTPRVSLEIGRAHV